MMEHKQDREIRSMLDMVFVLLIGYIVVYPFNQGLYSGDRYVDLMIDFLRDYVPLYVKPSFLPIVKAAFLVLIPIYCFTISKGRLANKIEAIKQQSKLSIALHMAVVIVAVTTFYIVVPDMGRLTPEWLAIPSLEAFIKLYAFPAALAYLFLFKTDVIFYPAGISKPYEKFITSVYRKGDKRDKRGYDTLKTREKIINKPVIGHKDAPLYFKHKLTNGTTVYNGNPRRANIVVGTAGSGKTYSNLDPMIIDTITNLKVPMVVYDFKFPTQIPIALASYMEMKKREPDNKMRFNIVTLKEENILNSWRINPICSDTILSSFHANVYMGVFMGAINPDWANPKDFWGNSVLSYTAGLTEAFNKHFPDYTLAHILAFINLDYTEQIRTLVGLEDDEINAKIQGISKPIMEDKAHDQVSGIFSTIQNKTSLLDTPTIFFGLSRDEASLNLNDPENPSVLCVGNDNFYKQAFGPLYSLITSIIFNVCNAKHKLPLHVMFDEAPTLFLPGLDDFINTGRSNGMMTTIGIQNMKQLYVGYGRELAEVLVSSFSNYYVGQTSDEQLAGFMSKLMGKYQMKQKNYSTGADGKKSSSASYKDMPIISVSEIQSLPRGYFTFKMAEGHSDGSIDSSMAMGMVDVRNYESIFNKAKAMPLPLSPSVNYLANEGAVSKDDINAYYKGDEKAYRKINGKVLEYAKREYQRIRSDVKLFVREHALEESSA